MWKIILLALALLVGPTTVPTAAWSQTAAAHQTERAQPAPAQRATPPRATPQRRRPEAVRSQTRHASAAPQRRQPAVQRAGVTRTAGYRDWVRYGADHAYPSREAAINDAHNVFMQAGWSAEAARAMQQIMRTQECERIELENGDTFDFMRSGGARAGSQRHMWGPTRVAFPQPTRMTLRAPACRWTMTGPDGVSYTAILPDVCYNLAGIRAESDCVLIDVLATHANANNMLWGTYREDRCLGIRRIAQAGEPEPTNAQYGPLTTGGCGGDCTLTHADTAVGRGRYATGVHGITPGVYRVRVRREQIFAICILTPGAAYQSSFSNVVWWQRHYEPFGRTWLATVHNVPRSAADVRNPDYLVSWGRDEPERRAILNRPAVRFAITNEPRGNQVAGMR